ncbi:GNAT family N-acetyltransferase [Streptomyces kaniharaensis]|uniref:GNAT family N-acetyltransferase n=1 Tax=Streptomyces kaniharaensis TaxID=212423 RepID=A0A6N7KNM6_9ACTN|nr:GNAT family N-acetyltransferase [Streptomyces kaniharaensis]MQS12335.1 GNAT family N-acetyltransferase [Streptomyces kaniharaensis]
MNIHRRLEQANDNAAAFWLAQARAHGWQSRTRPGFTAVHCARTPDDSHRLLVTRPYAEPGAVEEELADVLAAWSTVRFTLEDPYGGLDLTRFGATRMPVMPVMTREPGPVTGGPRALPVVSEGPDRSLLTVDEARDGDTFAEVEHAIVDGFPLPARQPWTRGGALPERLLDDPGCRAWLGRIDGTTAGACLTYDNGEATGLYWVATLPAHRGRGVARAVVETALAQARPDRPATLVATALGEPLYRKLGFSVQRSTCWWTRTSAES